MASIGPWSNGGNEQRLQPDHDLSAISRALETDRRAKQDQEPVKKLGERLETLTPRYDFELLEGDGKPKEIYYFLAVSTEMARASV